MRRFGLVMLIFLLPQACSDATAPELQSGSINGEIAVQKALQMINGTIIKSELEVEDGRQVWEVRMELQNGARIKIHYLAENGQLKEAEGYVGPFDYQLNPGMGLLAYAEARTIALNARNGQILSWKLEEDESDNRWEYRFFIQMDREVRVRIDARSGSVIDISD